ncbi:TetR/AcrR family transcriptional regulator [Nocardia tengchongensis]|uniref:TetR/AcrR family transcriptional regulator n=1 Tax=Nocardia tengchongensis TaxID=2055889 RepID=UPI0036BE3D80
MSAHPILRPTLAERRKQETRMDIARTAARLFAEYGTAAVTAEQIASESGVALRTFYRYARTKEESVEPMLAAGAQRWLADIAAGPSRLPTAAEFEAAAVRSLTLGDIPEDLEITRGLLHSMNDDQALRAIWHRINLEAERELCGVLTELTGPHADSIDIRIAAAAAAGAVRVGLELWAVGAVTPDGQTSPVALVVECMRRFGPSART